MAQVFRAKIHPLVRFVDFCGVVKLLMFKLPFIIGNIFMKTVISCAILT